MDLSTLPITARFSASSRLATRRIHTQVGPVDMTSRNNPSLPAPSTLSVLRGMPNVHFAGLKLDPAGEFELALGADRLNDIVDNKMRKLVLDVPASAYAGLSPANQRALVHLVKAARILNDVFLKQDHPDNLEARRLLEEAAARGDSTARKALAVFTMHNGIEGHDMYSKQTRPLRLFKHKKLQPGKAFYPQDLTRRELVGYLLKHPGQASAILGSNTVVRREGDRLVAEPFSVAFREEMEAAAEELQAAARETDHDGLRRYLQWQAQALVNDSDPEMPYRADAAWVDLEDSPLEFTIGRESYEDRMSADAANHPKVARLLEANGIKAKSKDSIGVRVGIVNRESAAEIADYRRHLKGFSEEMPLKDLYPKAAGKGEARMTFADVDLVAITGDYAAVRGGITIAQNLPNDDKLAVQQGEGSRLVFHRQVRQGGDPAQQQKFLDALIDPAQHAWYDPDSDFLFTVGHELGHSLGPSATRDGRDKKAALGKYGDMLEENKADLISIVMTDYFVKIGKFTPEYANRLYLTWAAGELPIKQPSLDEAHRARSVMQLNYFREKGAIVFEAGGKLRIVPEKMAQAGRDMLTEVVRLQLDGDVEKAEAFVKRYVQWDDALAYGAAERMKLKPRLYRLVEQPLADQLMARADQILAARNGG